MTKKKKVLVIVAVSLAALLLIVGVLYTLYIKMFFVYFGEEDRTYFLEKIRYMSEEVVTEDMPKIEVERINLKNSLIQQYTETVDNMSYRFIFDAAYYPGKEHLEALADDIARLTPENYARRYVADMVCASDNRLVSHKSAIREHGQEYIDSHHLDEEKLQKVLDRVEKLAVGIAGKKISVVEAKQQIQEIEMLAFAACPDETEELKADFAKVHEAIDVYLALTAL